MKKFALGLAMILASTALALAAAKTEDSGADSKADKAASGQKAPAKGHAVVVREGAGDETKTGDITIKGRAGAVTHVTYGQGTKPEAGAASAKTGGQ